MREPRIINAARCALLVVGGFMAACGGALPESVVALPGPALAIPRGNPVEADIANGYRLYGAALERWGRWAPDPLYAVHWCPHGVDPATFTPYSSAGHWKTSVTSAASDGAPTPGWGAPPGTPFWQSDDADTWGDITLHHGWWVHVAQNARAGAQGVWCWVPGAEETAARVAWREADGFVAWAPEPPLYEDADDAQLDTLNWTFELLGTLLDDALEPALLTGNAASIAYESTRHAQIGLLARLTGASRHVGPASTEVGEARHALTSYVTAHPVAVAAAASGDASPRVEPAHGSSRSGAAASETSAALATAFHATERTGTAARTGEGPLPPSMVLYEQMVHDAGMAGGAGFGMPTSEYLPFLAFGLRGPGLAAVGGPGPMAKAVADRTDGTGGTGGHGGYERPSGHEGGHAGSTTSSHSHGTSSSTTSRSR